MSAVWFVVLALSGSPSEGVAAADSSAATAVDASKAAPRSGRELEEAVRIALRHWARDGEKQADAAAREFLVLYKELQQDPRLPRSLREELRLKVRSRLLLLAQQIAKRDGKPSREARSVRVAKDAKVLGQAGGFGMMGGAGQGVQGGVGTATNVDAGEDLVAVIQQTVCPKTWEANGGPGTISYWRQQRAIVARTTQEVHEELSDLLQQLNRASH